MVRYTGRKGAFGWKNVFLWISIDVSPWRRRPGTELDGLNGKDIGSVPLHGSSIDYRYPRTIYMLESQTEHRSQNQLKQKNYISYAIQIIPAPTMLSPSCFASASFIQVPATPSSAVTPSNSSASPHTPLPELNT